MSIRAICFDLFHTLVDVGSVPRAQGAYTADILGVSRERWSALCFSEHHEIRRPTDHLEVIRTLAHRISATIPRSRIEAAARARQQRFDYALTRVNPAVLEVLLGLRNDGLRLGLVSNASTGEVSGWHRSPLAACFDTVVFSCQCGYAKPEAAIYELALERLGVMPHECLYIGDGGSDELAGAARVGIPAVLVTHHILGRQAPQELARRRAGASHELASLTALPVLLADLHPGAGN